MQKIAMTLHETSNHFGFMAARFELASGQTGTCLFIPDDSLTDKEERTVSKFDDHGKEKTYIFPAHRATFHAEKSSNGNSYAAPILGGLAKVKLDYQLFDAPQQIGKTAQLRF